MQIGIIGSPNIVYKDRKVKDFIFEIKRKYGTMVTIVSGGNNEGVESTIKNFTLEMELPYVEYNPSFTGHNPHSAEPSEYYTKKWHISHYFDRYKRLVFRVDKLIVVTDEGKVTDPIIKNTIKLAEKLKIPVILI